LANRKKWFGKHTKTLDRVGWSHDRVGWSLKRVGELLKRVKGGYWTLVYYQTSLQPVNANVSVCFVLVAWSEERIYCLILSALLISKFSKS